MDHFRHSLVAISGCIRLARSIIISGKQCTVFLSAQDRMITLFIRPLLPALCCAGTKVVVEGDRGDLFYIVKDGEAIVYQNTTQGQRKVSQCSYSNLVGCQHSTRPAWSSGQPS